MKGSFTVVVKTKQGMPRRGTKHVIYLATEFLSVAKSKQADIPSKGTKHVI